MSAADRKTVLVVDDDPAVRDLICMILTQNGYEPVAAEHGGEALEHLKGPSRRPRLILLDLMMPGMDGWQFMKIRESDPDLAGIPVAIITALANVEGQAPNLGVVDVLVKPSRIEAILETVARHAG